VRANTRWFSCSSSRSAGPCSPAWTACPVMSLPSTAPVISLTACSHSTHKTTSHKSPVTSSQVTSHKSQAAQAGAGRQAFQCTVGMEPQTAGRHLRAGPGDSHREVRQEHRPLAELSDEWGQGEAGGEEPFQQVPVGGPAVVAVTVTAHGE